MHQKLTAATTDHRKFLAERVAAAKADGKPFVIEEFGKYISRPATSDAEIMALRNPWMQDFFDIADESQKANGPIKGATRTQQCHPFQGRHMLVGIFCRLQIGC